MRIAYRFGMRSNLWSNLGSLIMNGAKYSFFFFLFSKVLIRVRDTVVGNLVPSCLKSVDLV